MSENSNNSIKKSTVKGRGMEVSAKWFLLLHLSLIVNSLSGVASKKAGQYGFMSLPFIFFFGMMGLSMVVFAVAWQQVLKHMSLTFAFTNKPITVIYALIWGVLIFHEKVTLKMVIGAAVILAGIVIGVSGND